MVGWRGEHTGKYFRRQVKSLEQMKKYIHIIINLIWLCLFLLLLILTKRDFFSVSQRLAIIDIIGVIFIFIMLHILYILIKIKDLKLVNIVVATTTLVIYIYFNGDFNPF
jgi:hypothetical protein